MFNQCQSVCCSVFQGWVERFRSIVYEIVRRCFVADCIEGTSPVRLVGSPERRRAGLEFDRHSCDVPLVGERRSSARSIARCVRAGRKVGSLGRWRAVVDAERRRAGRLLVRRRVGRGHARPEQLRLLLAGLPAGWGWFGPAACWSLDWQ